MMPQEKKALRREGWRQWFLITAPSTCLFIGIAIACFGLIGQGFNLYFFSTTAITAGVLYVLGIPVGLIMVEATLATWDVQEERSDRRAAEMNEQAQAQAYWAEYYRLNPPTN